MTRTFRLAASRRRALLCMLQLVATAFGCSGDREPGAGGSASAVAQEIVLQTTYSVCDTGLMDYLLPKFQEQSGIEVKPITVGSGQALENARRGNGDVVIAHSREAEEKFMAEGFGALRLPLMENDFIVVGPADDPAGAKPAKTAADVLRAVAEKKALFISRGDESGTHVKEKSIWKSAGLEPATVDPQGGWYIRAGLGMAEALRMADERRAYTLCDRGTYLSQKTKLQLAPLFAGDPVLVNRYSVIVVSAAKQPKVNEAAARKFAEFLTSAETKRLIGEFGKDKYGEPLFKPLP